MKIYQIHEYYDGDYGFCDDIVGTYLSKKRAYKEKRKLEAEERYRLYGYAYKVKEVEVSE